MKAVVFFLVVCLVTVAGCVGAPQVQGPALTPISYLSKLRAGEKIAVRDPKTGKVLIIFCCPSQFPSCTICPTMTPPPCVKLVDNTQAMQDYVISDTRVAALVAFIYSHIGVAFPTQKGQVDLPPVNYAPSDQPSTSDGWAKVDIGDKTPGLAQNYVGINTSVLGAPPDTNDPTQVVYHEWLHFFFDFTAIGDPGNPTQIIPYKGQGTVSLIDPVTDQPVTLTYDLTGNVKNGGIRDGFIHMSIHNQILSVFGSDKTSALREALSEAQWTPASAKNDLLAIAQAYASTAVDAAPIPAATPPSAFSTCGSVSPYLRPVASPESGFNRNYSYIDWDLYY